MVPTAELINLDINGIKISSIDEELNYPDPESVFGIKAVAHDARLQANKSFLSEIKHLCIDKHVL